MMPIAVGVKVGVGGKKKRLVNGPKIDIEYEGFLKFLMQKLRDREFIEQLVREGKKSEMFHPDLVRMGIYPVDFDELYFPHLRETGRKDLADFLDKVFTKWMFRHIEVDKNLEKLLKRIRDTYIRIRVAFRDGDEEKKYLFGKFRKNNFHNMMFSLPVGENGFSIVDFFGRRYLKVSETYTNPIGRVSIISILLNIPKEYDRDYTKIIFRKNIENIEEYKEILEVNYWENGYGSNWVWEWNDRWKKWIEKEIGEINKRYKKIFEDFLEIENSLLQLAGYDKFFCERLGLKADKENRGEFYVIYKKLEGGRYRENLFKFVYKFYKEGKREVLHFDKVIIYKKKRFSKPLRK